jgi:hypothetical protein
MSNPCVHPSRRRLGVDIGALMPRWIGHVEGVVEMVLDATANCHAPLSRERLFGWHAALFPAGYSGLSRIKVGALARRCQRSDAGGVRSHRPPARAFRGAARRSIWRPKPADF